MTIVLMFLIVLLLLFVDTINSLGIYFSYHYHFKFLLKQTE